MTEIGGIQGEHGPVAGCSSGGGPLGCIQCEVCGVPLGAVQGPAAEARACLRCGELFNATFCSLPRCRSGLGLLTDLLRVRYPLGFQCTNNA